MQGVLGLLNVGRRSFKHDKEGFMMPCKGRRDGIPYNCVDYRNRQRLTGVLDFGE